MLISMPIAIVPKVTHQATQGGGRPPAGAHGPSEIAAHGNQQKLLVPQIKLDDAVAGKNRGPVAEATLPLGATAFDPEEAVRVGFELDRAVETPQQSVDRTDQPSETTS